MRLVVAVLIVLAVPAPGAAANDPSESHPIVIGESRITAERLEHWARSARRLKATRERVIEMLIVNRWVELELARQGLPDVGRDRAVREARLMRRQAFRTRKSYRRFLRRSGQTHSQIIYRVRSDLRQNRLRKAVTSEAGSEVQAWERWMSYGESLRNYWRPLTRCLVAWSSPNYCAAADE